MREKHWAEPILLKSLESAVRKQGLYDLRTDRMERGIHSVSCFIRSGTRGMNSALHCVVGIICVHLRSSAVECLRVTQS